MTEKIIAYKGFDKDLKCRGFQFEVGKTYEHDGAVKACSSGFHACEHPLNVFDYYPPALSRFALVTQSGEIAKHGDDTKVASAKITIEVELALSDLVQAATKWVFDRAKWVDGPIAKDANEAATASGYQGAATAIEKGVIAIASAPLGKARAREGAAIVLCEYDDDGNLKKVHTAMGGKGRGKIKPDTWYTIVNGKMVEATE